jgi:protease-4
MSDDNTMNFNSTEALTNILVESLKQQKRARRWKAVTRFFSFLIFTLIILSFFKATNNINDAVVGDTTKPHTALIEIKGNISEDSFLGSASNVISSLQKAFKQENVKGIILDLNSPGGSPVQSDLIYTEIKKLKASDTTNKKVYAVVSDVCASGCYYLASAADEIYANDLSVVGSIGVLFSSFGAVELLKKLGIDRRLQTAGKYKAFLDPFVAETEEGKHIIQEHLTAVHNIFISKVVAGRGTRIKKDAPNIFSGLFWTGKQAVALGLVDGIKTKAEVAKDMIQAEEILDYTSKPTFADVFGGNFSRVSMLSNTDHVGNEVNLIKKWLFNNSLNIS